MNDPTQLHPTPELRRVVYLKPLLESLGAAAPGNVSVGEFTYYDDPDHALDFFTRNLRYNFRNTGARLEIGRFCAFATDVQFMMPEANHAVAGLSTYPFGVLGGAFAEAMPLSDYPWRPAADTRIGHDVWIGTGALMLPGVTIGHGAVIGARAVVTRDVPDYAVAAGNPARILRRRFDDATIARLLALSWWDWPLDRITAAIPALVKGELDALGG